MECLGLAETSLKAEAGIIHAGYSMAKVQASVDSASSLGSYHTYS